MIEDSDALAAVAAIQGGDVAALAALIAAEPALAGSRLGVAGGRTPLHIVSDWPGYFPNGPAVVALLIRAGANPNARSDDDEHGETPLHWAASSDDADVALALIEGGADLETPDGSIGTPLDNAIGYGCWHVARLLVARGARVDKLWHAAALGMPDQLEDLLRPGVEPAQISQAFWHACAGGQRRAAERLLSAGADLDWVPDYAEGTALDVATGPGTRRQNVIDWLRSKGALSADASGAPQQSPKVPRARAHERNHRSAHLDVVIRSFRESDVDAVVEFSVRAWEPVYDSLRQVLGDPIFDRLHEPDWRSVQAEAVRSSCTSDERDVFVAVADDRPIGFSAVALDAFHEGMGVIDIIAVDPAYQRRGVARQLIDRSIEHMRDSGMDIAAVGTGGDPGHAPARAVYEAYGFTALPGVRYLKLID